MNRAYQEELARVRIAALLETLGNLCGLWDDRIGVYGVDMENGTQTTGLCLITETETKGETK